MVNKRAGSTKIITPVQPGVVDFEFTDQWSAFDRGPSSQLIPGMGEARCTCVVKSFKLAHAAGLPTHFLEQVGSRTIRVQEFSVPGREPLSGKTHGHVLPLEWIWRVQVYGSLLRRINEKKIKPEALGFPPGTEITAGMVLPRPIHECTTKFEAKDRHLTNEQAKDLAHLDEEQWDEAWDLITEATNISNTRYEMVGFMCSDGKDELGMKKDGSIVIVDGFGTQDENRIIKKSTGEIYSKDLIRNHLDGLPWKVELERAKELYPTDKSKWPPYPALPDGLVKQVMVRYPEVARRYEG